MIEEKYPLEEKEPWGLVLECLLHVYTVLGLEGADKYAATLALASDERNDVWNCPQCTK